ncbi:hypothetical protein ciss_12010 [Carboxydothermus islandicus]|uniref:NarX-like N-terminal domain-containing protein n=1 Tax=Carboxydothermus islandicus TaxID=661089 RepID=A0A1L8D269_9THEO|nr:type IV pili methyl-accepting chemotaxis transducer N-terminal domain-containing protein [Carboxydothermus islandicus]GAV25268.1 hypothetical protein ciss_12010 [Carboxydothermus islandicus]
MLKFIKDFSDRYPLKIKLLVPALLIFLASFGTILIILGLNSYNVKTQTAINIAGRQRMQIQKLTKEILAYKLTKDPNLKVKSQETAMLFKQTLDSLSRGGTVEIAGNKFELTKAPAEVAELLEDAKKAWEEEAQNFQPESNIAPQELLAKSEKLYQRFDQITLAYQNYSKKLYNKLTNWILILTFFNVLAAIGAWFYTTYLISKPMKQLTYWAEKMAAGDLDFETEEY